MLVRVTETLISSVLFDTVLCDRNSVIRFLVIHGVIKEEYCCPKCGSLLKLNKHGKFRCDKKVYIGGEQSRCGVLSSSLKGTFFKCARISFEKIIEISYYFILNFYPQEVR